MPTLYVPSGTRSAPSCIAAQMLAHAPRFSDVETELTPRLNRETLSAAVSLMVQMRSNPASVQALSDSVQLPPLHTLMNPRNQMTSPLSQRNRSYRHRRDQNACTRN